MSENIPTLDQPDERLLESLCRQARGLADGLPGTLSRVTLAVGPHRVDLEWQAAPATAGPATAGPAAGTRAAAAAAAAAVATPITGQTVAAPLVGTVYLAPEPGAPPFVAEGGTVEPGQQVAIIEAMKIMNRVDSDHAGTVAKILVADGDMVEFGQDLMVIESGVQAD
jgi:acetyl-CoA carboxylase biotin carboxyl carrier protein